MLHVACCSSFLRLLHGDFDRYPYAFGAYSHHCCATDKEKDDGSGESCDGSSLHANAVVSTCCEAWFAMACLCFKSDLVGFFSASDNKPIWFQLLIGARPQAKIR